MYKLFPGLHTDVVPLIVPALEGNAVIVTLIVLTAGLHNTDVELVVNVKVIEPLDASAIDGV